MQKETGSTIIGILAIIAVAVLAGIYIGSQKDMVMTEIDSMTQETQSFVQKKMEDFRAKTKVIETEEYTQEQKASHEE